MGLSIIEYLGVVNDGISILFSWVFNDKYFEFIFWFNKKNEYKLIGNDNLLKELEVDCLHDLKYVNLILMTINDMIDKEQLIEKFKI